MINKSKELQSVSQEEKDNLVIHQAQENIIDFAIATDSSYQDTWFHETLAVILQSAFKKVECGEDARIILTVPPRHGKSELSTKKFPAWALGHHPEWPVAVASYSSELAVDFGQGTRDIMQSEKYQKIFNSRLRQDTTAKGNWKTKEGGGYMAAGAGGAFTGKGFKIGIIDDLFKNREEAESKIIRDSRWNWYLSSFYTRQEGATAIIVISTRWHTDDIIGRLLKKQEEDEANGEKNYDKWTLIEFPAIAIKDEDYRDEGEALWPEKFPIDKLNKIENQLGPYEFSALYQQNPITSINQEFKETFFRYRSWAEVEGLDTRKFATIDPGGKGLENDNTGIIRNYVDKQNKWNIKAIGVHFDSKELLEYIFRLHDEGFEKIGIEETVYLKAVKPFYDDESIKRNKFPNIIPIKQPTVQKEVRIRGLIPRYSSGGIFHIQNECKNLEDELKIFPKGSHDDVCLVSDTKILTQRGSISISQVNTNDKVLTRKGWRKVLWSGKTGKKRTITNIGIEGTPNHPIIIERGVIPLRYINESDILHIWNSSKQKIEKLSYIEAKNIIDIPSQKIINIDHILSDILNISHILSIVKYGLIILGKFQSFIIYTIKIIIIPIIILKIWSVYLLKIMQSIILNQSQGGNGLVKMQLKTMQKCKKLQKFGGIAQRVKNGIKNMLKKVYLEKYLNEYVSNVENHIRLKWPWKQNIVVETVLEDIYKEYGEGSILMLVKNKLKMFTTHVKNVLKVLKDYHGQLKNIAQFNVKKIIRIEKDVFNLEIEDEHEFFANNILVHNCDALAMQNEIVEAPIDDYKLAILKHQREERKGAIQKGYGL